MSFGRGHRPTYLLAPIVLALTALPVRAEPRPPAPAPTARRDANDTPWFQVAGVAANDALNIRAAPGASFEVLGTIPPDGQEILGTGRTMPVGASLWREVVYAGVRGWVNGRFLQVTGGPSTDALPAPEQPPPAAPAPPAPAARPEAPRWQPRPGARAGRTARTAAPPPAVRAAAEPAVPTAGGPGAAPQGAGLGAPVEGGGLGAAAPQGGGLGAPVEGGGLGAPAAQGGFLGAPPPAGAAAMGGLGGPAPPVPAAAPPSTAMAVPVDSNAGAAGPGLEQRLVCYLTPPLWRLEINQGGPAFCDDRCDDRGVELRTGPAAPIKGQANAWNVDIRRADATVFGSVALRRTGSCQDDLVPDPYPYEVMLRRPGRKDTRGCCKGLAGAPGEGAPTR
jgi:hypothetical protein